MSACRHPQATVVELDGTGYRWCERCGAYRHGGNPSWAVPTDTHDAWIVADKKARDERILGMAGEIAMQRAQTGQ